LVGEDSRRGRVYLPEADLKTHNLTLDNILDRDRSENLVKLLQEKANQAREFYQAAIEKLPREQRQEQRTGLIMASIYLKLLDEIETNSFDVLDQKIKLTPIRKLWAAWKCQRSEKKLVKLN